MKKNKEKKPFWKNIRIDWVFVGILALALALRLWKVAEFFSFNFDEEYQAHLAASIVKDFHIIWIGVNASDIGYYLGPGFTYLNAFLFWISRGDPTSLAYFSALFGVATCASIYVVVKQIYSRKPALFAALFYAGSALINSYDRRFWNPSPVPFIAIWMYYALVKTYRNPAWFILAAILMGASFHSHLSLMTFWPLLLYVAVQNRKKITPRIWLMSGAGYFVMTAQQLMFDAVHNFDNLRMPLRFITGISQPGKTPLSDLLSSHLNFFYAYVSRLWYLRPYNNLQNEHLLGIHNDWTSGNPLLALLTACVLIYILSLWKNAAQHRILILALFIPFTSFLLYPNFAGEYYLLSTMAMMAVAIGIFFNKLPLKVSLLAMAAFLTVNTYSIVTSTQAQYGLAARKRIVQEVSRTVGNRTFKVETYGLDVRKYHSYGGWRYLFEAYGTRPNQSFADEFFGWIYPTELDSDKPELLVVINEDIDAYKPKEYLKRFTEGAYIVYITTMP